MAQTETVVKVKKLFSWSFFSERVVAMPGNLPSLKPPPPPPRPTAILISPLKFFTILVHTHTSPGTLDGSDIMAVRHLSLEKGWLRPRPALYTWTFGMWGGGGGGRYQASLPLFIILQLVPPPNLFSAAFAIWF